MSTIEIASLSTMEKRRAMRLVTIAWGFGTVWYAMLLPGCPTFTGYARLLGADDLMLGILGALPGLASLFQLLAAYLIERSHQRKLIFLLGHFGQRLLWFPLALLPFAPLSDHHKLLLFALGVGVSFALGHIGTTAWQSWMNDLIAKRIRGRYFANRATLAAVSNVLAVYLISRYIDAYPGSQGFAVALAIAAACGTFDIILFFWVPGLRMQQPVAAISLVETVTLPWRDRNFRRFLWFTLEWYLGLAVAGPFFSPYFLEVLQLSYGQIAVLITMPIAITQMFCFRSWGRTTDRCGAAAVLQGTIRAVSLVPILWILCEIPGLLWLAPLNALLCGLTWSGVGVSELSMLYEAAPEHKKSTYLACWGIVAGLSSMVAPIVGGCFMRWTAEMDWPQLGPLRISNYHVLFIVSGLARLYSTRHITRLEKVVNHGPMAAWRAFLWDLADQPRQLWRRIGR